MQDTTDHCQAMCRGFAHPLGIGKSTQPLNSLSGLKSRHHGPHLGLIHPESNWWYIENPANALRTQGDLNSSDSGRDRSSNPVGQPWVESANQSREDRLRNSHHWQPSHPSKYRLKSKVLKLGEIDASPWNNFPLGIFLFIPLVVFDRAEKSGVVPRLSASLGLICLRWLSRALALSPGSGWLSPRCHPKGWDEGDEAEERDAHTPERPQAREYTDAGSDAPTEEEIAQMRRPESQNPKTLASTS